MKISGKTSWGADWTYNDSVPTLHISLDKVNGPICICDVDDVFEDSIPLTMEQRREIYVILETHNAFSKLVEEASSALLQLHSKIEDFAYQRHRLQQSGSLHERAKALARKISAFRDELLHSVSDL